MKDVKGMVLLLLELVGLALITKAAFDFDPIVGLFVLGLVCVFVAEAAS